MLKTGGHWPCQHQNSKVIIHTSISTAIQGFMTLGHLSENAYLGDLLVDICLIIFSKSPLPVLNPKPPEC